MPDDMLTIKVRGDDGHRNITVRVRERTLQGIEEIVKNTGNYTSSKPTIYNVVTQVDLTLPLISNILGFSIFQVSGDTEVVES